MTEKKATPSAKKNILNTLLVLVAAFILYQVYAIGFSPSSTSETGRNTGAAGAIADKNVVQINILNGCGVSGTGQRLTNFLRASGYDVVEMGNYKTYDVKESLVIDRSGNADVAQKLASDLGIEAKNVIQQINSEYFVTASVVIGKDFKSLRAWK